MRITLILALILGPALVGGQLDTAQDWTIKNNVITTNHLKAVLKISIPGNYEILQDQDKIILDYGAMMAVEVYSLPDAVEYMIILKGPPKTAQVSLFVENNLTWYYQPALTPQQIKDGSIRPINVIGSYAVYNGPDKKYHVYRPLITDALGLETWGEYQYNKQILTVKIPQAFLDKAVYPVYVDPTFGFTSVGGSRGHAAQSNAFKANYVLNETAEIDSLNLYVNNTGVDTFFDIGIYNGTDLLVNATGETDSLTEQWYEVELEYTLPAGTYGLGWKFYTSSGNWHYYDSTGGAADFDYGLPEGAGLPDPFQIEASNDNKYSIYAEYDIEDEIEPGVITEMQWFMFGLWLILAAGSYIFIKPPVLTIGSLYGFYLAWGLYGVDQVASLAFMCLNLFTLWDSFDKWDHD